MLYELAELYDEQYKHYRDDLAFYTRLADDYGSPVLELGAGTGRVSAALAKAGHKVVGLDISDAMLARARRRIADEGLQELVELIRGDMRSAELGKLFPLVIAPFNALAHAYSLNDQENTLATVIKHLADGALFAFDVPAPEFDKLERLRRAAEWDRVGGDNAELFIYQRHDPDKQLIESKYYLDTLRQDGSLERKTATLLQRYYTRFELGRLLQLAGFRFYKVYGSFDKKPYTYGDDQLICLAWC